MRHSNSRSAGLERQHTLTGLPSADECISAERSLRGAAVTSDSCASISRGSVYCHALLLRAPACVRRRTIELFCSTLNYWQ